MLFVYIEDHQGYSTSYVLMESKEPVKPKQLEDLSWSAPGAGRVSTPAYALIKDAKLKGWELVEIERRDDCYSIPTEWEQYPVVLGATGNY